uniref:Tudor domain-containing protein 1 n=1 Tax=Lygus hesperus TaxID=30085 RepID=A0A146LCC1_LYGHE
MNRGGLGGGRSGPHIGPGRGALPGVGGGRGAFQTGGGGRGALLGMTSTTSGASATAGSGRGLLLGQLSSSRLSDSSEGSNRQLSKGTFGASRDLSDELKDFQPMHEAYNDPKFNSYTGSGPGTSLHPSQHVDSRRSGDKLYKLHVANIQSTMTQKGLENIFNLYGDTVSVFIYNCSGPSSWGFVEYKKLEEAQNAIENLDRKHPYNLSVKFAKEKEQKDTDSQDINTPYCKVDTSNRGRKATPLLGMDPRNIKPKRNYNDRTSFDSNGYHNGKFSNYNPTPQVEVNNLVMEKNTMTSQNGAVVRGGRAYNPPRIPPTMAKAPQDDVRTDHFQHVEKFKKPAHSEEDQPPEVTCPFKQGNCTNCQAISATVCHVCKAWFCSYSCMENDWGKHKLVCRPRTVSFKSDGTIDYHDIVDRKRSQPDQKLTQPEPVGDKSTNGNSEVPPRKSFEANQKPQDVVVSDKAEESPQPYQPKTEDKPSSKSTHTKIDYAQHPPEPRDDGYVQSKNGITTNRNSKYEANIHRRELETQTRRQLDTASQSAEAVRSDEPPKAALVAVPATKKKPAPEPPIPRGTFTECLILYTTPDNERFAVTPINLAANQDEMMADLAEYFCQPRANVKNLKEGTICASIFEDELWYRVRVTSLDTIKGCAKIYFIDFGNDYEVSIDDLKELPDKLQEIDPMAFHIVFVGGKKPFQINNAIKISPIKPTPCGSWLVRTPEDPEPPEEVEAEEILAEDLPEEVVQETPVKEDASTATLGFPLSKQAFMTVTIMHVEEPGIYWVLTLEGMHALIELNKSLDESAKSKVKITPEKGQMYNCKFSGIWCRALLTSLNPCTVFFIDYGNAEEISPDDLLPLPLKLKSTGPLAIRIKLAEGTSSKYFTMEEMATLSVRALEKLRNVVLVLVEGESYVQSVLDHELSQGADPAISKKPNHVLSMLTPKSDAFVVITKAFGEDYFCGSLQISNCPEPFQSVDAISTILKMKKANPNYKPVVNDDVIAKINTDSRLYRGYVMCVEDETSRVALIDLGCVETPSKLAALPQEFKDTPPCGVRVSLHQPTSSSLSVLLGSELSLGDIKIAGEEVTAVLGSFGRATITPWVPLIEEARVPAFKLENKTEAMITAFHSPQAVYLRPLTPACIEAFSCIIQDVCAFCITAEPLQSPPLLGELVAARWNIDNNFYRALVSKKEKDSFKVIFLDFGNLETVVLDDLRKLPANFKKIPATVVKVGLKDVPGPIFNLNATQIMNDVVANETKVIVGHEGDLRDVVLTEESSGDILNKILAQAMEPSWVKNASKMYLVRPYMNTDIKYDVWEEGTKLEGAVVGAPSHNQILFVNRSNLFEYIHTVLTPEMTKYCQESKETAYNPRPNELVLAKFEGDWYRAVCTSETRMTSDPTAMVFFIDYGNMGEMAINDMRKIVPEFASIPAAVKHCRIYGLPRSESISEENKKKITEALIALESIELIVVKQFEDGTSVVWVPSLVNTFTELGVPYNRPVGLS